MPVPRQYLVERVDHRRETQHTKDSTDRSSESDLVKEQDAPTAVALDWRTIAEHEPPTFPALFVRHRGKEAADLLISERKQGKLLVAV